MVEPENKKKRPQWQWNAAVDPWNKSPKDWRNYGLEDNPKIEESFIAYKENNKLNEHHLEKYKIIFNEDFIVQISKVDEFLIRQVQRIEK